MWRRIGAVVGNGAAFLVVAAFLLAGIWIVSYIPVLNFWTPHWIPSPQPTVTLRAEDIPPGAQSVVSEPATKACQHTSFWVHPFGRPPSSVKIVVTVAGHPRGEVVVSCSDHSVISQRAYRQSS